MGSIPGPLVFCNGESFKIQVECTLFKRKGGEKSNIWNIKMIMESL